MRETMMIQCDEYNEVWDDESRHRDWQMEQDYLEWHEMQEEMLWEEYQGEQEVVLPSLVYHYFELYINSLSNRYRYDVREELKTGRLITHSVNVSYDEMKDYVRMVWIDSCPPKFVISVTQEY